MHALLPLESKREGPLETKSWLLASCLCSNVPPPPTMHVKNHGHFRDILGVSQRSWEHPWLILNALTFWRFGIWTFRGASSIWGSLRLNPGIFLHTWSKLDAHGKSSSIRFGLGTLTLGVARCWKTLSFAVYTSIYIILCCDEIQFVVAVSVSTRKYVLQHSQDGRFLFASIGPFQDKFLVSTTKVACT